MSIGSVHRSLARGLELLETISDAPDGATLSELVAITGFDKSSVSRLVTTLSDLGYVVRLPDRRIVLTGRVLRLTHGFQAQFDLQKLARPLLTEFRDRVGESIVLTIREGNFSVSIDQLDPEQTFRMVPHIGNIAPLDATAAGRSMLFALAPPEQQRVLEAIKNEPIEHPEVRLDPRKLRSEVELVRRQGYVWIKRTDDVERVSAVVLDMVGAPLAAVSVYGPKYRMQGRIDELGRECKRVADALSVLARGHRARDRRITSA
ncbi:IclR family transcriptional regulator [Microbacterium keratanolyticum]|uniref:IclR family transcriptional regulator n=1 Tax=Microbacterium keratanolyticum TaxID=67574 RepID=UPI00363C8737